VTTEARTGDLENLTAGAVARSAPGGQVKKVLVRTLGEKLNDRDRRKAKKAGA
jgi:hypothetical protein